jgi:hypothetical protein
LRAAWPFVQRAIVGIVVDDSATVCTRLLRTDQDPVWARLRSLMTDRGLDPQRIALATFFPDDGHVEFGIVVDSDDHVYEFDFVYGKGDLNQQAATATITDWRDRTEWWSGTPHRNDIEAAFRLLAAERG